MSSCWDLYIICFNEFLQAEPKEQKHVWHLAEKTGHHMFIQNNPDCINSQSIWLASRKFSSHIRSCLHQNKKTPEYCEAGATSQAPALQLATGYQLHIATWFQWCFAQWEQKTLRDLEVWHLSVWTSFTKMDLPSSSSSAVITFHHFNCLYQALWSVMNFWQTTISSNKRVKYTMILM